MRSIPCSLLFVLVACGWASAQPSPDLQIQLGAYVVTPLGGEHPGGVWFSTGPVAIGKPSTATYSFGDTCEAWAVSSAGSVRDDATTAWTVEIRLPLLGEDAGPFAKRSLSIRIRARQLR
jgi:hypothetical protein